MVSLILVEENTRSQWYTRYSLLNRAVASGSNRDWSELVGFYEKFIYSLLHRFGIRLVDQDDLVQEILVRLWKSLHTYDRDTGRFRTWLSVVVRNAAIDYLRKENRAQFLPLDQREAILRLEDCSQSELEKIVERDWKLHLTNLAMQRVREVFSGKAIEVFRLSCQNVPAETIARQQGISRDSVYTLTNRVKMRLVREVRRMIEEYELLP